MQVIKPINKTAWGKILLATVLATPLITGLCVLIGLLPNTDGSVFELRGIPLHLMISFGVVVAVTSLVRPAWHGPEPFHQPKRNWQRILLATVLATPFMGGVWTLIKLIPATKGPLFEPWDILSYLLMTFAVVMIVTLRLRPDWHGLQGSKSAAGSQDDG